MSKAAIVREARSWIGTRFHHQGRMKKTTLHDGGCDCIGLVVGVARELQLLSHYTHPVTGKAIPLCAFDDPHYGRVPANGLLQQKLDEYLQPIPLDQAEPGDVVLFRFDENPQHVAIVSDYHGGGLGLIHTYLQARRVVEHRLDETWQKRAVAAYVIPMVEVSELAA